MSDAEVMTSALIAVRFFGGNQEQACNYLFTNGLIPKMGKFISIFSSMASVIFAIARLI
ncbi:MAG: hypothetical protein AAF298_20020 [Cyanobacteria bacterium P01_A01_bin.40]